jgi:hypothetical protein
MTAARQPTAASTRSTDTAAYVTSNVMKAIATELLNFGIVGGVAGDPRLRDFIYARVLSCIQKVDNPSVSLLAATIARAPEPTRAQTLVESGLLDVAAGMSVLSDKLTTSVMAAVGWGVSERAVNSAIKRTVVEIINGQEGLLDDASNLQMRC